MDNEARESGSKQAESSNPVEDEDRKIRRLQIMMNMVMSVICQDTDLTVEEASELVANSKRAALATKSKTRLPITTMRGLVFMVI